MTPTQRAAALRLADWIAAAFGRRIECDEIAALLAEWEADPVKAAHLATARAELKQRLAEPVQEPIGEVVVGEDGFTKGWTVVKWRADLPPIAAGTKLYTHPSQQRKPLTDVQIDELWNQVATHDATLMRFARAIERAHGIVGGHE